MQSVLFVMRYYLDSKDNLSFKFKNQIQAAKNIGLDVWYFAIENNSILLCHDEEKYKISTLRQYKMHPLLKSIYLYITLYKAIPRAFQIKKDFDFVYLRSMTATPALLKSLRIIKQHGAKLVVEIPTYPSTGEYRSEKRLLRKILLYYGNKMDKFRDRYVDLFTLIGDYAESYSGKPAVNIENGICLNLIPEREAKANNNDEIHCLALASMSRWQGYDRFIQGMYDYKKCGGKERIVLHLAGDDGDGSLKKWRELSILYHLEGDVIFEGAVYGERLDNLVNLCDIGIGTLGGYRKNMGNSSTLKIREYTARGLPFIYAVEDRALTREATFALKVPDDDSPIDMNLVINFVKKTRSRKDLIKNMRDYAKEYMSWDKQFKIIINKLVELDNKH